MKQNKFFVRWFFVLLCICTASHTYAQSYLEREDEWVKSKLTSMTLDEKIGQLFIVRAYSKGDINEEKQIAEYINKYHIGGICFFQGSPFQQVRAINKYQQLSSIPLFMAIDGEWGLAMRFPKQTVSLPKQMMLGAIQDNRLIYEMGREVAKQCKMAGINLNFAPSVDININPDNPVIFDRSFGESPTNVAKKGYMYMKGMEDEGIMACIKHFPGHGDTDVDSHDELPILNYDIARLEQYEFYPFRRLASQGASAIMVGHLNTPKLDPRPNRPATLSQPVVDKYIRKDISFNGLIITDAMDMKGVTKYFPNGTAEAEAFLAGNDIILLPENISKAIQTIKEYIRDGKISQQRIDISIERILRAKYKIGLNSTPQHSPSGVTEFLSRNYLVGLKQKLTEAAMTVVADKMGMIPIRDIQNIKTATLSINLTNRSRFQMRIGDYVDARHYQLMPNELPQKRTQLMQIFNQFDQVIIGIHTSGKLKDFSSDISPDMQSFLKELQQKTKVIIVLFGSPYLLKKVEFATQVLLAYDNESLTQDIAAQSLFGVNDINGKLPVSINDIWCLNHGLDKKGLQRLGYSKPEMVNMSSDTLRLIDSIMAEFITLNAAPGAQVLVAKDGKIIFQKSYGKLSPDGGYVTNETIYDIASITKIMATTISTMKLVDERKININSPLRHYIAGIDTTNKASLVIQDIMAHHARLIPWIGFYKKTLQSPKSYGYNPMYYSGILQDNYTTPVAKGMFLRTDYKDSIYLSIYESSLKAKVSYKYSDIGFYLIQKVIENQSGKSLDMYASENFYAPLGLRNTGYLPLLNHSIQNIAPTESDTYWRRQVLKGYVHDMGAAMLGGVGGHAGLFSTAKDMAIIMQMLLNKGIYGGVRFIQPETISLFTTRHSKSTRRGLGFDMKELSHGRAKSTSVLAPSDIFGHTGFTGTAAWADPTNNIVYIFNCNRTYAGKNRYVLNNKDYRTKIQTVIYKAMHGYSEYVYL